MTATLQRRLRPAVSDTAFHRFISETVGDLDEITAALAGGKISVDEWAGIVLETLAQAHAQAGYLGRQRAGDSAPFDADDNRFGQLVAQEEWPFLQGFAADLHAGRYTDEDGSLDRKAIQRRARLYALRVFGTANEALALVAGEDEVWHWKTQPGESCADCLRLEAHSPYPGKPPTMPKEGMTACLTNCNCVCFTATGLRGFAP